VRSNVAAVVPRRYVIDTHACVFLLAGPRKLGARARRALERVERGHDEAWIPAAVAAEVVLLHELGRIRIGLPQLRETVESVSGLRFLPLDLDQLDQFASLTSIRDAFDRLIVSAARSLKADLISRDEALARSGLVSTVWA
jgi:PIN domain nuclease of toxin-antitoxin system